MRGKSSSHPKAAALLIGLAGLAVATSGVAVATVSAHSHVSQACVKKSSGRLRIVSSAKKCTSHEKPLSFVRTGRPGPRGPRGTAHTFEMYADIDQDSDVLSGVGVTGHALAASGNNETYEVTFAKPVGSCAFVADSGSVGGGTLAGDPSLAVIDPNNPHTVDVSFDAGSGSTELTSFMLVVTCAS